MTEADPNVSKSLQAEFLRWLHEWDDMTDAPVRMTTHQFILRYGCWYERYDIADVVDFREPQQCYKNATDLVINNPHLVYCEGYALFEGLNRPTYHAWVTGPHGYAIDVTWRKPGLLYAGVPFDREFLLRWLDEVNPREGVIDDWQNNYPLLGELSEHPVKWRSTTIKEEKMLSTSAFFTRP